MLAFADYFLHFAFQLSFQLSSGRHSLAAIFSFRSFSLSFFAGFRQLRLAPDDY
jgi:hypothetical protein